MLGFLFDFCGIIVGGAQLYLAYKVYLLSCARSDQEDDTD